MRRLRDILRRSGTIVLAAGGLAAAVIGAVAGSIGVPVVVAIAAVMVAMVINHDQLVRRLYKLDREQTEFRGAHARGAEVTQLSLGHVDARLELAALQLRESAELQQRLLEAHGRTHAELPGLREYSAELTDGIERSIATLTRETYQRLNSAHWHRERLYQQVEALSSLSNIWAGGSAFPPFRDWALSPDVAVVVSRILAGGDRKLVVELGSGSSTALISRMMSQSGGGRLISIDHEADFFHSTAELVAEIGDPSLVEMRLCQLTDVDIDGENYSWYDFDPTSLPDPIDLLFVDGPPGGTGSQARFPAQILFEHVRPGGLILLDDALRDDEARTVERWAQRPDLTVEVSPPAEKGLAVLRKLDDSAVQREHE